MAVFAEPTQWSHTLGNSADTVTIPDDTGASTGLASLQKLFQQINQLPLSAGGVAPKREDFNGLFKLLGDYIFYLMNGGVASYNSHYDYSIGAFVKYDNLFFKSVAVNGPASTVANPYNQEYWVKIPTYTDIYNFTPTGVIMPYAGPISTIPDSYLVCNGANISRTTFANLYTKIGTTYGAGDGSTTFGIPDIRDKYIIGANVNPLGTNVPEQLPNIKAAMEHASGEKLVTLGQNAAIDGISGAFSAKFKQMQYASATDMGDYAYRLEFDASKSSSIYTDSGKVYTAAVALNFIIRY